jgi:hypothetical protein
MDILFLGNGRCYHTMDWFRSAQQLSGDNPPVFITDLICSESFEVLLRPTDRLNRLVVIDSLLFRSQSRAGDIWRNLLKLLFLPLQALKLRRLLRAYKSPVVHAHSVYYVVLARLAGCRFVATPQGSEVLVRPYRSKAYRLFSGFGLAGAGSITVDSESMRSALFSLFRLESRVVQNGIDVGAIAALSIKSPSREKLVSIRGYSENYRIDLILDARQRSFPSMGISFCYPFVEGGYKALLAPRHISADEDLGRLSRGDLYQLLLQTLLVVSIPQSDSSPRSVYEAIFCGCCLAVTEAPWVDHLPSCMRSRLVIVDLASDEWLADAWKAALRITAVPYSPSEEALDLFDQQRSMRRIYEEIYPALCA